MHQPRKTKKKPSTVKVVAAAPNRKSDHPPIIYELMRMDISLHHRITALEEAHDHCGDGFTVPKKGSSKWKRVVAWLGGRA